MLNYILADLARIIRRIPRWIILAAVLLIDVVIFIPGDSNPVPGADNVRILGDLLKYVPAVIGFIEILYVFGDDFRGKTAQIAIGIGVSRGCVVLSKWLEVILLSMLDTFLITYVAHLSCAGSDSAFPPELYGEISVYFWMCVISTAAYMALVLPVLFAAQGTTLAVMLYILLSTGAVHKVISVIGQIDVLVSLHLSNLTLTNCLNVFRTRWILGSVHAESLIGILLYVTVALTGTILLYRKKELEF